MEKNRVFLVFLGFFRSRDLSSILMECELHPAKSMMLFDGVRTPARKINDVFDSSPELSR
jgi:hypothetical protein